MSPLTNESVLFIHNPARSLVDSTFSQTRELVTDSLNNQSQIGGNPLAVRHLNFGRPYSGKEEIKEVTIEIRLSGGLVVLWVQPAPNTTLLGLGRSSATT